MTDEPAPKPHAPKGRLKAHPMDTSTPMDTPYTSCTTKSKQSGVRCKRRPIPGGTVCVMHGGKIPAVKAKAEERLQALLHPAITRLGELVDQKEFPSVAIAAVKDVLDRNMGKAAEKQTVEHTGGIEITWKIVKNRDEDDTDNLLNP